ncbi:hypothetical protein TNIN_361211 [Trichonephila inaurata madagascariensis]|uniref:Uncharacterized protein n=1 Tax=Trichonephila inaurata madagascariensis TaxID=2747483 RepID=A0A8X7BS52_9ARAC|nr:hypothetical protein TNIN_361211 [Trichonephila inaurata madagascariensis]
MDKLICPSYRNGQSSIHVHGAPIVAPFLLLILKICYIQRAYTASTRETKYLLANIEGSESVFMEPATCASWPGCSHDGQEQ